MKVQLKNISIKWQLMTMCVLLVAVPVSTFGILSYKAVRRDTFQQIEQRLQQQSQQVKLLVESAHSEIEANLKNSDAQARKIIGSQAEALSRFLASWKGSDEALKDTLASIKVGQTGYIWVVDYQGNLVVSQDRKTDGQSIWNATDAQGNHFIQEAIAKARNLTDGQTAYQLYPWKNQGESQARDKISALLHDIRRNWVVGIGVYFDELTDTTFAQNKINALKDQLARIVVGKTGYIFILDQSGNYVLHHF